MKNYLFLVCLVISAHATYVHAAKARIPEPIMEKIETRAASDFPSNKSAQRDAIKAQTEAYSRINNYSNNEVPAVVLKKIRISTTQYYPYDYSAQLFFINQQVNSYLKLGVLSDRLFPPQGCRLRKSKVETRGFGHAGHLPGNRGSGHR